MFAPLPETLVIAFGHKARQGKDQAAEFIRASFSRVDIQRFAFADALRAVCRVDHGMTLKDAPLLQRVGTERRLADPDVWSRALYWTIAEKRPQCALITDCRLPHEAALVKAMGGFVVRVDRRRADGGRVVATDRDPQHETETALEGYDDWDAAIENPDGDRELFRERTLNLFVALAVRAGKW